MWVWVFLPGTEFLTQADDAWSCYRGMMKVAVWAVPKLVFAGVWLCVSPCLFLALLGSWPALMKF